MKTIDLTGKKFGLLTVRAMLPGLNCLCDCDCGARGHVTQRYSVSHGLARSCGCLKHLGYHNTHGESRSGHWAPEYRAWVNMNSRCYIPNYTRFANWGGRGISVCGQWRKDYAAFLAYVGRKPSADHSLDRYPNPDGNYEPGNVRWATASEQRVNRGSAKRAA